MKNAITSLFLLLASASAHAAEISHGPILGRPGSDTMSVWARTNIPAGFTVRYGTETWAMDQEAGTAEATKLKNDCTAVVTLKNLEPGTTYYYEVSADDSDYPPKKGSFRTWKSSAGVADPKLNPEGLFNFKFEFACGNNPKPEGGAGHAMRVYDILNLRHRSEVDFAILNGDWLYEEKREYQPDEWAHQVGIAQDGIPPLVKKMPNITGIWENYKIFLDRAPNLAEWHAHVPTFYTADDHELVNDIYGSGTTGFKNRRAVVRDVAYQAWFDYLAWANPTEYPREAHVGRAKLEAGSDVLTDPNSDFTKLPLDEMANLHVHWFGPNGAIMKPEPDEAEADPNYNVYEIVEVLGPHKLRIKPEAAATRESTYSIGRRCYGKFTVSNCDFFLLDTRTDRELHNVKTPAKPGLQMLGEHQEKWLTDSMKSSESDFFFVVSSVNFMVPHVGTGGEVDHNAGDYGKDDAWTVFLDQRERLIEFWDKLDKPVFVLTGDLHNSFAIKITDNVWEFASGPHNSVNHAPADDEGGRPANGPFKYGPREAFIRWSSYVLNDIERLDRIFPHYCVVQVNNVFNNPKTLDGEDRWVAFPVPHVIFRYYDARTGEFRYAETIHAKSNSPSSAKTQKEEDLYLAEYHVPPVFLDDTPQKRRRTAKEVLVEDAGVEFGQGAQLYTKTSHGGIVMRNTRENHERLAKYLESTYPGKWKGGLRHLAGTDSQKAPSE